MATLRPGLKVVTYPGKCKQLGTSLPCCAARGRRLAVRIGQVIEKGGAARAGRVGGRLRRRAGPDATRRPHTGHTVTSKLPQPPCHLLQLVTCLTLPGRGT